MTPEQDMHALAIGAAPVASAGNALSERDEFEACWLRLHGRKPTTWASVYASSVVQTDPLPEHLAGRYFTKEAENAWEMWQARAALASQSTPVAPVVEPPTRERDEPVAVFCARWLQWHASATPRAPEPAAPVAQEPGKPVAYLHYAVKKPSLQRLAFTADQMTHEKASGWVVEELAVKGLAAPTAAQGLSDAQIDAVIGKFAGGCEWSDDEHDSAVRLAKAILSANRAAQETK